MIIVNKIIIFLVVLIAIQTLPVFAEDSQASLQWKLKFWWQDNISNRFAVNDTDRLKTLTDHVIEIQKEIQEKAIKGEEIPNEFESRRKAILDSAETVLETIRSKMPSHAQEKSDIITKLTGIFDSTTKSINELDDRIKELKKIGEYNDILQAVHDFQKLRNITDPKIKAEYAYQLDIRVNMLDSVKNGCEKRIDSMEISKASDPYRELQENYCNKSLNGIELNQIRSQYGL